MDRDTLLRRIRADFYEMPGMRLTLAQAGRLWALDSAMCQELIDELVASTFLRWTAGGMVVRAITSPDARPRRRSAEPLASLDRFVA